MSWRRRSRAGARRQGAERAVPHRRAGERRAGHAGVLPRDPRGRRRAHVRENFFIALYDEQRQLINWPYYVDEITDADDLPDPNQWYAVRTDEGRGPDGVRAPHGRAAVDRQRAVPGAHRAGRDRGPRHHDRGVELARRARSTPRGDGRRARRSSRTRRSIQLHRAGQGPARVRRPARRRRALAGARDRGDAAAERRAGADQQRPGGARRASSTCRRSTTSSATRSRRSSTPRSSRSRSLDETTGLAHYPYIIERGERLSRSRIPRRLGFTSSTCSRPGAAADRREPRRRGRAIRQRRLWSARCRSRSCFVPLLTGGAATGVISLQNIDREHAFGESDQRLLRRSPAASASRSRTRGWCTRRGSGTPSWR